jgi:ABC-2 type transport system permease protein
MMLHLIKKDFLLAKKFLWITMGLVIVLPLFIILREPEVSGVSIFLLTVIFAGLPLGQYISMTELKYPKAETLLCATPYTRTAIVIAKYVFSMLVYAYCCIAFGVMALIFPEQTIFSVDAVVVALLVTSMIYGVYTPVQFKLGAEKTKYVSMVVLMAAGFGSPTVFNLLSGSGIDLTLLFRLPIPVLRIGAMLTVGLILGLSLWVSIKVYTKKEL